MGFWNSVGKWLGAVPVPVPEPTPAPVRRLTFYALGEPEQKGEVKYARSVPGGMVFMFEYRALADPKIETIRVLPVPNAPPEWEEWFPLIRDGVSLELERVAATDRVVCLRVELQRFRYHAVYTSPVAAANAGGELVLQLTGIDGWPPELKLPALPPFPAAWRTDAVVGLARAAAEDGRFAALPVLADALEEVGCDDPLALAHLRTCTDHAPRCWVADWVLAGT